MLLHLAQGPSLRQSIQVEEDDLREVTIRRCSRRSYRQLLKAVPHNLLDIKRDEALDWLADRRATDGPVTREPARSALHAHPEFGEASTSQRHLGRAKRPSVILLMDTCRVVSNRDSATVGRV